MARAKKKLAPKAGEGASAPSPAKPEHADTNTESKPQVAPKAETQSKSAPKFRVVLECTRVRCVGPAPVTVHKPGDRITIESNDYDSFVAECAKYAAHFRTIVEGEWPNKPHPQYQSKVSEYAPTFLQRIKGKMVKVEQQSKEQPVIKTEKGEVIKTHICRSCNLSFLSEEALERHKLLHKSAEQTKELPQDSKGEKKE